MRSISNRIQVLIFLLGMITLAGGCEEDLAEDTVVITEDIIYLSAETVRLTGRVLSIGAPIQDHGFVISNNEDFSTELRINLGLKERPGRFIGDTLNLVPGTEYFAKSFVSTTTETVFGNVKSFTTLLPSIIDFTPNVGTGNQLIVIRGVNFPHDSKVFFGDEEAQVREINFESQIVAVIPEIKSDIFVAITVRSANYTAVSAEPFEYVIGKWEIASVFPEEIIIKDAMFFKTGNEFIVGFGFNRNLGFSNRVWKLDLNDFSWKELAFQGVGGWAPFQVEGLWGSGALTARSTGAQTINTMWSYSNESFTQLSDLPFQVYQGVGFRIQGKTYAAGGRFDDLSFNDVIYAYDEQNDSWEPYSTIPFGFDISSAYPNFVHNEVAYFMKFNGELLQYMLAADEWTVVSNIPTEISAHGVSIVMGDKVYIGLFEDTAEMWELDIPTLTWTQKSNFKGFSTQTSAGSFAHNGKVYVLRSGGEVLNALGMRLWSFVPDEF